MSRRFGRNQKRRMREELLGAAAVADYLEVRLAECRKASEMDRALLRHQSEQIDHLRSILTDAIRIAGEMSAIFPTNNMKVHGPARGRVMLRQPTNPWLNAAVADFSLMEIGAIDHELNLMLCKIQPERLQSSAHVRVTFGDGAWGYAISDAALLDVPLDILSRRISEELGKFVAVGMKQLVQDKFSPASAPKNNRNE